MDYSILDLLDKNRAESLSKRFIQEFMNGDCRVFSDIVAWFCSESSLIYTIVVMQCFEHDFCHSWVEVQYRNTTYYVDCRGAFNSIEEFIREFGLSDRDRSEILHLHKNGKVETYQIDDVQFSDSLSNANWFKNHVSNEENRLEEFFIYQCDAFSYLVDRCLGNEVRDIEVYQKWT